jgi:hypothetical protein
MRKQQQVILPFVFAVASQDIFRDIALLKLIPGDRPVEWLGSYHA